MTIVPRVAATFCPFKLRTGGVLVLALSLAALSGCNKANTDNKEESSETSESKAVKKKAAVDALLRANGIDPTTVGQTPPGGAHPSEADGASPSPGAATITGRNSAKQGDGAQPNNPTKDSKVTVEKKGAAPHQVLRYQFKKGRVRKFNMDMMIAPQRTVNGQPIPGIPPVQIAMKGTSTTTSVSSSTAERENTFLSFTPSAKGMPPEMLAQMSAQFSELKGIQLIESVSTTGQVQNTHLKDGAARNPQVLALMQNLQDGMSNAFLALPEEAVGVGAKWKETTLVNAAGLSITQVNEVELLSLKGSQLTVALTFKQSAGKQEIQAPGLPPGAKVELVGMQGGGKGTMKVNLSSLVTDSKVDLNMSVDTKISGVGSPEPVNSATVTTMKIHMLVN